MHNRQQKLVISFKTTADAMAMERLCREQGLPGRLIPTPRVIAAGCGLAWCADCGDEALLRESMDRVGYPAGEFHTCSI